MTNGIETTVERLDLSDADVAMLAEMIADDKPQQPTVTVPARRGPKPRVDLASMSREEELAHKAAIRRKNYQAKAARKAAGSLTYDEPTVRDALADAAIMMIAHGLPGTYTLMSYIARVYHDKAGVPLSVKAEARSGRLKPKLLAFAK